MRRTDRSSGRDLLEAWFRVQGWRPWDFQREAWEAFARGEDGLIHVPTGAGKTYAAFGGPLCALVDEGKKAAKGLRIIYVTPLRALARDIEQALATAAAALGAEAAVESRTGDTSASLRARQRRQLPEVLVTTPESLALIVARPDAAAALAAVSAVIVDEWHELVATKRGLLLTLTLARLRTRSPAARTWGITATIADPEAAARALVPAGRAARVIRAAMPRPVVLKTLLPEAVEPFPWAGHMGLTMVPRLVAALDIGVANLVFTNTRSQAERWYQALLAARPEWARILALHHGSLALEERTEVEEGVKLGRIRVVVATSSLDLGVDFPNVEAVWQVGSPKGVARLVQRAGRSAHRPLAACTVTCLPANSLELLELAAARRALAAGAIEARPVAGAALDVLTQHMVTCAVGGGFQADELFDEVRTAEPYAGVTRAEFDWCLQFIVKGGTVLGAYEDYQRVVEQDGVYTIKDRRQAQLHLMNIGTIVADEQAVVTLEHGKRIGWVDESYIARLKTGDRFVFAGRTVELVKKGELSATVRLASGRSANVPAWQGSSLPLSPLLGEGLRTLVGELAGGCAASALGAGAPAAAEQDQKSAAEPAATEQDQKAAAEAAKQDQKAPAEAAKQDQKAAAEAAKQDQKAAAEAAKQDQKAAAEPAAAEPDQKAAAKLAAVVQDQKAAAALAEPELAAAAPLLLAQRTLSLWPAPGEVLLETWEDRDGSHLFVYPFAGQAVHEALAALLALRLSRKVKTTFALAANDYGFALVSGAPLDFAGELGAADLSLAGLEQDLAETVDAAQAAKRRFREVARIAGIVKQNYPSQGKKRGRAVHASAALLFDTLARFDPEHPLIVQARREAAEALRAGGGLVTAMGRIAVAKWRWVNLRRPSPLAFPLLVERVRARVGSESLAERVARMQAGWLREEERANGRAARARRGKRASDAGTRGLLDGRENADRDGPPLG